MEDVVEGIGRVILRIIKWLVIETLVETVIYWYGRLVLNVLTLGRYPPRHDDAETPCILTGIAAIALIFFVIISLS